MVSVWLNILPALRALREAGNGTDIEIIVADSVKFAAHSAVLRAAAPYFETMFSGRFTAKTTISFPDAKASIFKLVLDMFYGLPVEQGKVDKEGVLDFFLFLRFLGLKNMEFQPRLGSKYLDSTDQVLVNMTSDITLPAWCAALPLLYPEEIPKCVVHHNIALLKASLKESKFEELDFSSWPLDLAQTTLAQLDGVTAYIFYTRYRQTNSAPLIATRELWWTLSKKDLVFAERLGTGDSFLIQLAEEKNRRNGELIAALNRVGDSSHHIINCNDKFEGKFYLVVKDGRIMTIQGDKLVRSINTIYKRNYSWKKYSELFLLQSGCSSEGHNLVFMGEGGYVPV